MGLGETSGGESVVLASASASRARLLSAAGVPHIAMAAAVDEGEVKAALRAEGADPLQAAETLADLKAQRVAPRHAGALVIGADQILECEGQWFDKPVDRRAAADHLRQLSGRTHRLCTAVCLVRQGARIWHHRDVAHMTMRVLNDSFIEAYLDAVGAQALTSVGAYQVEGRGAQLFSAIDGDYFAILGLPLLPLLEILRRQGAIPS